MEKMEDLDISAPSTRNFQAGDAVEAPIVQIGNDSVFIDVGQKSEGYIEKAEFVDKDGNLTVKEGDTVKAFFAPKRRDELRFTTRIGGSGESGDAAKQALEQAFNGGIPVEGKVEGEIKGGYEVKIDGVRAFCPYSQMGARSKVDASEYVGKTFRFLITEFKSGGKNIVVSNRKIHEAEAAEQMGRLSETLTVGVIVKGVVKSLQNYGAFVEVEGAGGFQALLPISEISHNRVEKIEDALQMEQEVEAKIIKSDFSGKRPRVSLSMKALEKDPWDGAADAYPVGMKVTGTVARTAGFGLFVNLAPGLDGLVHVSTLGLKPGTNLGKKYPTGTSFDAVVEGVDEIAHKISLRPAASAAQDDNATSYMNNLKDDNSGETYNPFKDAFRK